MLCILHDASSLARTYVFVQMMNLQPSQWSPIPNMPGKFYTHMHAPRRNKCKILIWRKDESLNFIEFLCGKYIYYSLHWRRRKKVMEDGNTGIREWWYVLVDKYVFMRIRPNDGCELFIAVKFVDIFWGIHLGWWCVPEILRCLHRQTDGLPLPRDLFVEFNVLKRKILDRKLRNIYGYVCRLSYKR